MKKNSNKIAKMCHKIISSSITYSEQVFRETLISSRLLALQVISVKYSRPAIGQTEQRQFLLQSVEFPSLLNTRKRKGRRKLVFIINENMITRSRKIYRLLYSVESQIVLNSTHTRLRKLRFVFLFLCDVL